jgi:hypothetical protein
MPAPDRVDVMPALAREAADQMGALLLTSKGIQTATTEMVESAQAEEALLRWVELRGLEPLTPTLPGRPVGVRRGASWLVSPGQAAVRSAANGLEQSRTPVCGYRRGTVVRLPNEFSEPFRYRRVLPRQVFRRVAQELLRRSVARGLLSTSLILERHRPTPSARVGPAARTARTAEPALEIRVELWPPMCLRRGRGAGGTPTAGAQHHCDVRVQTDRARRGAHLDDALTDEAAPPS